MEVMMRITSPNLFENLWSQVARMIDTGVRVAGWMAMVLVASAGAQDADWAQWGGPARDGKAAKQSLLSSWPEGGPKLAWSYPTAGLGYSTAAVSDGRLYTMGQVGADTLAICLDANTGKEIWTRKIDRGTEKGDYLTEWGGGPRSTPTIDGDLAYFLTDLGQLAVLNTKDGSPVWGVHFVKDLGGKVPQWGYSESLLVDGDRVLGTPGGENFIVGFNKKTGERVYTSKGFTDGAQYVSIIKTSVGSVPIYITAAKPGLVAFHAETGEFQFKSPTTGNGVAVIPTPVVTGNQVYHSTAYKAGNTLLELSAAGDKVDSKEIYHFDKESMENHHGGYILDDGTIYGFTNSLRGAWMAQDLKSGAVLWSKKVGNGRSGSIAYADGLLYCYDDADGICYLVKPSKEGWQEQGQVKLPQQTATDRGRGAIWAHPVIANKKLFIRDQEFIYAFDIGK
jgi:hypothetical protein